MEEVLEPWGTGSWVVVIGYITSGSCITGSLWGKRGYSYYYPANMVGL